MRLDDPTLRSSAQDIISASRRASELTEQLLHFSRQQPLARYNLDLCAVVGKLERLLRRLLGRGVNLDVSIPDEPAIVCATEGLIQQILTNLVVNARDAVNLARKKPGLIEITVEVIGFTHEITDGIHGAIVRARKPSDPAARGLPVVEPAASAGCC